MKRSLRWTLLACVVTALAMFVTACGSSSDDKGSSKNNGGGQEGTKVKEGKKGGKLTYLAAADIDYLDPGQTYYQFGYVVAYAVNRTLYSFKPEDSVNPVPDLAEDKPEIAADNKTITVKIKKGVKYAPPVNREVKAADIKYAFERAFSKNVPSGYAGAYFQSIDGAPKAGTGDIKPISGITTPDDYTLVFKLKEAQAPLVSQALVMPITTPVPKEVAEKYDAKTPSTYDQYVAFTGPYMVKNDPQTGKVTGRATGKSITIVRNPNWDAKTDYRPAYLDSIQIQEGNDDLATASRRALSGSGAVCCDSGAPPAQVLKQALSRNKEQVAFTPSGGTRYIAFNTKVKPFDNVNIRKAIIAASDRTALRLTRGGELLGDIANGWLPPGLPGFEEAGGLKQNEDLDYLAKPEGDVTVAKKYMDAAKADGVATSNGKYTGGDKVLTIATNADPGKKTAEVFQNQIEELGFKLNFRIVPQDTLYTKFCGVPKAKVAICPNVGWFKDFSDPQSMLDATFNGDNILQQGNVNWPQLDDPAINAAMKKAGTIPVGADRNKAWADINRQIAEQAPGIPWIWDKSVAVSSKDVSLVTNGYNASPDLNYSSIK